MQGGMAEMAQSDGEIENSVLCKICAKFIWMYRQSACKDEEK